MSLSMILRRPTNSSDVTVINDGLNILKTFSVNFLLCHDVLLHAISIEH